MGEKTEILTVDKLQNRVYVIRGRQVMLDTDLAMIYGYEVKRLNQQVKRNISRFPEDFMFQLTEREVEELRLQNVTANINNMRNTVFKSQSATSRQNKNNADNQQNCKKRGKSVQSGIFCLFFCSKE